MAKWKVKKNDQVLVLAGKDRGARGRVMRVLASPGKALVVDGGAGVVIRIRDVVPVGGQRLPAPLARRRRAGAERVDDQ